MVSSSAAAAQSELVTTMPCDESMTSSREMAQSQRVARSHGNAVGRFYLCMCKS